MLDSNSKALPQTAVAVVALANQGILTDMEEAAGSQLVNMAESPMLCRRTMSFRRTQVVAKASMAARVIPLERMVSH